MARIGTEKKQLLKPSVKATNTFLISKNWLVPWTCAQWFWEVGVSVKILVLLQPVCMMIRSTVLFIWIFFTTCHTMPSVFYGSSRNVRKKLLRCFLSRITKGRSNHRCSVFELHLKYQAPGELLLHCMITEVWLPWYCQKFRSIFVNSCAEADQTGQAQAWILHGMCVTSIDMCI